MRSVDIKYKVAEGVSRIMFEPWGATFELSEGEMITLRAPIGAVPKIETLLFPTGISVWVPDGDYVVLNAAGEEIESF